MATTIKNGDPSDLDAKTDVGAATGHPTAPQTAEGTFDREINVRGILWAAGILLIVALVVHLLMWWLLAGFRGLEDRGDVRLTPIQAASPQQAPPEPHLQVAPEVDLRQMRAEEDLLLHHPGWVDQGQGTVRVPIDVAIDVIAARGVEPGVLGGTAGDAAGNQQGQGQRPPAPEE